MEQPSLLEQAQVGLHHHVNLIAELKQRKIGIGAGVARTFSQNGISKLALIDINPSSLQKASESLRQRSPDVELLTAAVDVTNEAHVDNAVQKAATKFGRVDIGVNCAGVCDPKEPTDRLSLKDWQRTININQTGVWLSQRALIRQMLTQTYYNTNRLWL